MPQYLCCWIVFAQGSDVGLQAIPLGAGEFVGTDQTHTDAVGVIALAMRADLAKCTAGGNGPVGVDHEVIADGRKFMILQLAPVSRPPKPALNMPAVDIGGVVPHPVRAGAAVDDDFAYLSHAARVAAWGGGVDLKGFLVIVN